MIFLLVGAPGAGKGTQCDLIAKKFPCRTISTGDVLRKHIKNKTEIGLKAEAIMASGKLVSDAVLLDIMRAELKNRGGAAVLLDGYPRTLQQAKDLHELVGDEISAVMHLDVSASLLEERLGGRLVCDNCGKVYHKASYVPKKPGTCDSCQGNLVSRPDDQLEKIKVRLKVFQDETAPILGFYRENGLYNRVDGSKDPEHVFRDLAAVMQRSGLKESQI